MPVSGDVVGNEVVSKPISACSVDEGACANSATTRYKDIPIFIPFVLRQTLDGATVVRLDDFQKRHSSSSAQLVRKNVERRRWRFRTRTNFLEGIFPVHGDVQPCCKGAVLVVVVKGEQDPGQWAVPRRLSQRREARTLTAGRCDDVSSVNIDHKHPTTSTRRHAPGGTRGSTHP
jgi:hypothetical protein